MKPKLVSLTLCLSLLLLAADVRPSFAQGFSPYSYMYLGQSLLYPATRLMSLPFMYGTYNANPFFSTNSYLRPNNSLPNVFPFTNASYGPWGYRNAGMMPGYFNNGNNGNQIPTVGVDAQSDIADPNANTMNSVNPYLSPPPANTGKPPAPVPSSGGAPGGQALGAYTPYSSTPPGNPPRAGAAPQMSPIAVPPVQPASTSSASGSAAAGAPVQAALPAMQPPARSGTAGNGVSGESASHSPIAVPNANPSQALGRPLAEGFINHLNSNYQGDMAKALNNTDTRSWAKAMGIIGDDVQDGSHLSSDRLDILGRLLKDTSLDPVSKLDTMRILLKKPSSTGN
jgi:hypothetical protein